MPGKRSSGIVGAFSSRDFRLFIAGHFSSVVGVWLQRLAIGWLAWDLTGSGFWLGAVAFADLFPVVVIGPFAGVLADRRDRRRILLVFKCLHCLQAVMLAGLVGFGVASIGWVCALALYGGCVIGAQQAARHAIVPGLVGPEHLGSAVAISSVCVNVARFVGPALAGLIIAGPGVTAAFATAALGHVVFVMALLAVRSQEEIKTRHGGVFDELAEGFRYILRHATIGRLLGIEVIIGLFARPIIELLPGFAGAVFERGAGGLAFLVSSVGIGAIIGGLWLAQRSGMRGLTTVTLVALCSTGALAVAFAATGRFWLGVLLMALLGAAMVISGAGAQTLVQRAVAGHMRGRVLGIWGLAHRGIPAFGAFVMGWSAEFWGFGLPVAAGGLLCMVVAATMFHRRATLIHLVEDPDQASAGAPAAPAETGGAPRATE